MEENDVCPQCGEEFNGYECDNCGFADLIGDSKNQYEARNGNIIWCTEEEAFDKGYISICPSCCYNVVSWWEMDDHGMCIECWHKKHTVELTGLTIRDII